MRTFKEWVAENTASDVRNFDLRGAFNASAEQKAMEYAKRIVAGEKPEVVMQGFKPNSPFWNNVMQKVSQLQGNQGQVNQPQLQGNQGQPSARQKLSVSEVEREVRAQPGTLDISISPDGKWIKVTNKNTGDSKSVPINQPDDVYTAAAEIT